ncbi:uncharacterized protein [Antennarius striatus]|uniref:uncharacterized protein n=1 Tax=Antennarius striatus TaxID=241820 RepID=UPI0035B1839A
MASTLMLFLQLLLVSLVSASHHFGGTGVFFYKGRSRNGINVEFRTRETFRSCIYSHFWRCYSGNCGRNVINKRGVIDQSTNAPQFTSLWCTTETVQTWTIPIKNQLQIRSASCCWITTRNFVYNWRLLASLDLGNRSDTGQPNQSPNVAMLPFLRVPQNCPRTYKLMAVDPDHDQVRCRYGTIQNVECSRCDQPSGFILNQDTCTLHYNYTKADYRVFGFEMVVEDIPRNVITLSYTDGSQSVRAPNTSIVQPLSKLPLQFSFLVDPPAPSCKEGEYLPKLVYPTPENGMRITAEVNKQLEITVKALVKIAKLTDVIMNGPLNITKKKTTHDEFEISWTPTPQDLGSQISICFAAESSKSSSVYQSEMRCVVVDVNRERVKSSVICNESTMTVMILKSSIPGINENHLKLNDATNTACRLRSNSTYIFAVIPLSSCGTQIKETNDKLIFSNDVSVVDNIADVITRKQLLEVQFSCQYSKRGNVTMSYSAHRRNITVEELGFGTFTYQFEFYHDNQYRFMIDPSSYPLEYEIGTQIYMQIEATSSVKNTELFVESCKAAPYDNPNFPTSYSIIDNGCSSDSTVQIYVPNKQTQFQLSMEAFKFIGMFDQVYISCSVIMCEAKNPNTRCSKGCTSSSHSRSVNPHSKKRAAITQSSLHFVSQGPLRLKRSTRSSEVNLNLNLVLMAGCLLAAVGIISAVVMYKIKTSKIKYQMLSTSEN